MVENFPKINFDTKVMIKRYQIRRSSEKIIITADLQFRKPKLIQYGKPWVFEHITNQLNLKQERLIPEKFMNIISDYSNQVQIEEPFSKYISWVEKHREFRYRNPKFLGSLKIYFLYIGLISNNKNYNEMDEGLNKFIDNIRTTIKI